MARTGFKRAVLWFAYPVCKPFGHSDSKQVQTQNSIDCHLNECMWCSTIHTPVWLRSAVFMFWERSYKIEMLSGWMGFWWLVDMTEFFSCSNKKNQCCLLRMCWLRNKQAWSNSWFYFSNKRAANLRC